MARKSKETVLKERLREIGNCPFDIFRYIDGSEENLQLIARCENGDTHIIKAMCKRLYQMCADRTAPCEALLYLMERAIHFGETSVCEMVIDYCLRIEDGYPLAIEAVKLLSVGNGTNEKLTKKIVALSASAAVSFAARGDAPTDILEKMNPISKIDYPFEWLFVMQRALNGKDTEIFREIRELAESIGMEYTCLMPCFCSEDEITALPREVSEKEIKTLSVVLMKHSEGEWRDLWIRCMYELMEKCDKNDKFPIAESVISVSESRPYYKKRALHTLAWCSYLMKFLPTESQRFYDISALCRKLKEQCIIDGLDPDIKSEEERSELMRECVYLSSNTERRLAQCEAELGFKIQHRKNRYILECDLHGHSKRSKMHFWNVTLSISAEESNLQPPKFDRLKISKTKNVIQRGGVLLERGKTSSQSVYYSEISINNVKHPFELDLILDISYISAVKCSEGEIRIVGCTEKDGYIVMNCQIFLY